MGKTVIPLATINLACPSCKKTNPISFNQEITTLPAVNLAIAEKVVGKCESCGHTFEYKTKNTIYKYMDKNKLAYRKPPVLKNRLMLAAPIIIIVILIVAIAAFTGTIPGSGSRNNGDRAGIVNGSSSFPPAHGGNSTLNQSYGGTSIAVPTATPMPPSPLNISGKNYYDPNKEMYYLPVSLAANASPVDLSSLTVTVRLDYSTVTPNAWEYDATSCFWTNHSSPGSVLGRNDSATLVVDMSNYNFPDGTNVYLDFTVPGYAPLTCAFEMNRTNGTMIPRPPVIESGSYDYESGKNIVLNNTDMVKVSGRVIINKWPESNIDVSFYDNYTTTTVTSVENGYYITNLERNQSYDLEVWSPSYGMIYEDKTPHIFTNDTTLDIILST